MILFLLVSGYTFYRQLNTGDLKSVAQGMATGGKTQ